MAGQGVVSCVVMSNHVLFCFSLFWKEESIGYFGAVAGSCPDSSVVDYTVIHMLTALIHLKVVGLVTLLLVN